MKRLLTTAVLIALGLFLLSPVAWGCDVSDMLGCSMTDCPMSEEHGSSDCDQSEESSRGCGGQEAISADCCDEPADRPVAGDLASQYAGSRLDLLATEVAEIRPEQPPPLPVDATFVICTQQHDLGRFTILSSYLI